MSRRPSYLDKYTFNWELLDVIMEGKSPLDTEAFVGVVKGRDAVCEFLTNYGLNPDNSIENAELFGNFQETLQFIRRYFLKEGNLEGLDYQIPIEFYSISDIGDLFLIASKTNSNHEMRIWAEIIIKVMHTILHVDKDLRSNYFSIIQTQIFDRFYKYICRDDNNRLFLGSDNSDRVPLVNFETKAKKTRESVIIKLLYKVEHVAEELFDRVGVRFVTESKADAISVIKFLIEKNIVIPHNIKPSRSFNSIIDLKRFKKAHNNLVKVAIRNNLSEERFIQAIAREAMECIPSEEILRQNKVSLKGYNSIQFTCRQLIKYVNPFFTEFNSLRTMAKDYESNILAEKILSMDVSLITSDVSFFYPYEVQVVDKDSHLQNTEGRGSHIEYKKSQLESARDRLFNPLRNI